MLGALAVAVAASTAAAQEAELIVQLEAEQKKLSGERDEASKRLSAIRQKAEAEADVAALKKAYENKSLTLTGTQSFSSRELMLMIQEIMGQKVNIIFDNDRKDPNHYDLTPYRFSPKVAWKIVPTDFYDLGQGILDLVEEIYRKNNNG